MNNQENYTYTPQELSLNRDQNISVDIYNKQNQMQTNQGIDSNYAVYNPDYVPDEIKGWHWGAFFWNWVWLVPVNTTLAIIMCFANIFTGGISTIVLAFYLGIKGNEMAWQSKQYKSIEEFKEEQKKWTLTGLICILVPMLIGIVTTIAFIMIFFGSFMSILNSN